MKRIQLFLLPLFFVHCSFGQNITGIWNGALQTPLMSLRLVIHITKTEDGYRSTMDSPDQNAFDMPVTSTTFDNRHLKLIIKNLGIEYLGTLNEKQEIEGIFKQGGQSFPLKLARVNIEKKEMIRSQEPTVPFPYYSEDIMFGNKRALIKLAGTLTLPQKNGIFPAVVLISGSGAQNRDEEVFGHKPFLVLSDFLTRNGIAVLRFDDRGTAASTGNFASATSFDFSTDVEAAVNYLLDRKEIDKTRIGLIGHSEGGMIASMVASVSDNIAFIVLLAASGVPGGELLLQQQKAIGKALGMSNEELHSAETVNEGAYNIVVNSVNTERLKVKLSAYFRKMINESKVHLPRGMTEKEYLIKTTEQYSNPWIQYFIRYNPAEDLEKVKCPVLTINGGKDLQVPPKENLLAIKAALEKGGNKDVTIKELSGLNHLFQECTTGLPNEYMTIEQTLSPIALNEVLNWLNNHLK